MGNPLLFGGEVKNRFGGEVKNRNELFWPSFSLPLDLANDFACFQTCSSAFIFLLPKGVRQNADDVMLVPAQLVGVQALAPPGVAMNFRQAGGDK